MELLGYQSTDPLTYQQVEMLAWLVHKDNVGCLIDRITGFKWSTYEYYHPLLKLIFKIANERESDMSWWIKDALYRTVEDCKDDEVIDLFKSFVERGVKLTILPNLLNNCIVNYKIKAAMYLIGNNHFKMTDETISIVLRHCAGTSEIFDPIYEHVSFL